VKHEPILLAFIPHTPSPIELGVVLVILFGTLETSAVASLGVGGLRLKSARDRCLKQNVPDAKQLSFPNGLHVKWIWAVRRWIATTVDVCCTQCNCLHSLGGSGAPDAALGLPFGLPEGAAHDRTRPRFTESTGRMGQHFSTAPSWKVSQGGGCNLHGRPRSPSSDGVPQMARAQ